MTYKRRDKRYDGVVYLWLGVEQCDYPRSCTYAFLELGRKRESVLRLTRRYLQRLRSPGNINILFAKLLFLL